LVETLKARYIRRSHNKEGKPDGKAAVGARDIGAP
jgi:hypothetical protein